MRVNSYHTSPFIAGILLLSALAVSGCAGAVVGVGTAAVAASTTEKGFSTSVSDGVIFAKLKDSFIKVNASLLTSADVAVNDEQFYLLARSRLQKIKLRPLNWHGELKACARWSMNYK